MAVVVAVVVAVAVRNRQWVVKGMSADSRSSSSKSPRFSSTVVVLVAALTGDSMGAVKVEEEHHRSKAEARSPGGASAW